jgi:tRNA-uridine 2-sulfurtransferase
LLSQEQLQHSIFPLGDYTKAEVRDKAKRLGLPVASKRDSQDFADADLVLHKGGIAGPIITSAGVEVGRHSGISNYTIGQRRGLGIAVASPLYVSGIDAERNAVIVGGREDLLRRRLIASSLNWVSIEAPAGSVRVAAKIRAGHNAASAVLQTTEGDRALVQFDEAQMAITPGQTVVFYDGDIVLGAGIIERSEE